MGGIQACEIGDDGRCMSYRPGHAMHWIHSRLLLQDNDGWRRGLVRQVRGLTIEVVYPEVVNPYRSIGWLWHHSDLSDHISAGQVVRVNERRHGLLVGGRVHCIGVMGTVASGLGSRSSD